MDLKWLLPSFDSSTGWNNGRLENVFFFVHPLTEEGLKLWKNEIIYQGTDQDIYHNKSNPPSWNVPQRKSIVAQFWCSFEHQGKSNRGIFHIILSTSVTIIHKYLGWLMPKLIVVYHVWAPQIWAPKLIRVVKKDCKRNTNTSFLIFNVL